MKYIILFLGIVFFSCQQKDKVAERIIAKLLKEQQDCWNEGDIKCFMKHYWKSDSLKFITKDGITYGWENTLKRYQKKYSDKALMGELQFDILSIEPFSDKAVMVIGKWQLYREAGDIGGHFTLIWKRVNGRWVITSDHTS